MPQYISRQNFIVIFTIRFSLRAMTPCDTRISQSATVILHFVKVDDDGHPRSLLYALKVSCNKKKCTLSGDNWWKYWKTALLLRYKSYYKINIQPKGQCAEICLRNVSRRGGGGEGGEGTTSLAFRMRFASASALSGHANSQEWNLSPDTVSPPAVTTRDETHGD